jgi:hypothetical protein
VLWSDTPAEKPYIETFRSFLSPDVPVPIAAGEREPGHVLKVPGGLKASFVHAVKTLVNLIVESKAVTFSDLLGELKGERSSRQCDMTPVSSGVPFVSLQQRPPDA